MGAHDRIPPDPAISRHDSPNGVPAEPSGTRLIRQIDEDRHRQIYMLAREEIIGPPPLFARLAGPHTAGQLHCRKGRRGKRGSSAGHRPNPTISRSGRSPPPEHAGQGAATTDDAPLLLDASRRSPQAPARSSRAALRPRADLPPPPVRSLQDAPPLPTVIRRGGRRHRRR
jgi:hypothetical protein